MYFAPSAEELVTAVRGFLAEHDMPQLEGRAAFHARVAANALAIVERQLGLGPEAEAAERRRLTSPLGLAGRLEEQNRELCRRIRSAVPVPESPALREHLRATAREKLAVDQPRYGGYLVNDSR